jgi:NDP-sugar pyrophosphorylase family protein
MSLGVTALVLCGGKGERLKPLTESIPKPLVMVNKRPILSYILEHVARYGLHDIVIAAGYMAEKIEEYVATTHHEKNIQVIDSGDVDIIQRIKDCAPYLTKGFILLYGDTLADVDIYQLQSFHEQHASVATVTLWPLKSQFGLADLDLNSNVIRFREKPVLDHWINIGYFCFKPEALSDMQNFQTFAEYLESIAERRLLRGFRHDGFHITINSIRELEEAEYNINKLGI